ncbi:unnamed protein product [Periconia digitata]|uniref:Uncharacterized protein n=1 Tax=Periconia digitata TaxID=1303443 RepID=A0A9W4US01_9PLEO|nr:unnamed protein product [Periconia digitata]
MNMPFGYTHRNKRSHDQMDLEDSASPPWGHFNHRLSAPREPSAGASHSQRETGEINHPNTNLDHTMPRRYHGDGLDFRRPVVPPPVIDLTDEDAVPPRNTARPPRFSRDIMNNVIDLESDEPQNASGPSEPDIQFIASRPIHAANRRPTRHPTHSDASEGGDDEVEFLMETRRALPSVGIIQSMMELPQLRVTAGHAHNEHRRAERQRQATENRFNNLAHAARTRTGSNPAPRPPPRRSAGSTRLQNVHVATFIAPRMEYARAAFALGIQDEPPSSPAPTYDAPSKAPDGFTRSPQEEDSLVCPNCEDELCIGNDELKRQVWIVKQCGHVYCGECTANRSKKGSAKGKERQSVIRKPFKECVVEGCNKKVSPPKSMIQVFL